MAAEDRRPHHASVRPSETPPSGHSRLGRSHRVHHSHTSRARRLACARACDVPLARNAGHARRMAGHAGHRDSAGAHRVPRNTLRLRSHRIATPAAHRYNQAARTDHHRAAVDHHSATAHARATRRIARKIPNAGPGHVHPRPSVNHHPDSSIRPRAGSAEGVRCGGLTQGAARAGRSSPRSRRPPHRRRPNRRPGATE